MKEDGELTRDRIMRILPCVAVRGKLRNMLFFLFDLELNIDRVTLKEN